MNSDNHNNNTSNRLLHLMNYKFYDWIRMHEHILNRKITNFHDFSTWRINLNDMRTITMFIFWLCTTSKIIDPNILPYMNVVEMMRCKRLWDHQNYNLKTITINNFYSNTLVWRFANIPISIAFMNFLSKQTPYIFIKTSSIFKTTTLSNQSSFIFFYD
jgi:hypothetical protein